MVVIDDEYDEFLSRVEDVSKTIEDLKSGKLDPKELDRKEEQAAKEAAEAKARRESKQREAEEKVRQRQEEARKHQELRDANRDKIEELKEQYYMRKARRERWEAFRASQKEPGGGGSKGFTDYYRGWDLFEEDPDDELFDGDNPAAVQDQSAFDAMAKDIKERTARRKAEKAAAEKEKERGNVAFKGGQFGEALSAYSCAIEHHKGDKAVFANRALAHLKLRNFLSAIEDCGRAIEIATFLDEDSERRPCPPPLLKAHVRRASAYAELGRWAEAEADLELAAAMAGEKESAEVRKQQLALRKDRAAAEAEAASAELLGEGGAVATSGGEVVAKAARRVRELLETLQGVQVAAPPGAPSESGSDAAKAEVETALEMSGAFEELFRLMGGADSAGGGGAAAAATAEACRLCLRQAGGVALLVRLLARYPAGAAEVLLLACEDRRGQRELHASGGSTAVLRSLRSAVPTTAEAAEWPLAAAGSADALVALSQQLWLLARCCNHAGVAEQVRPLAAGEAAYERLARLLALTADQPTLTADKPSPMLSGALVEVHGAAAALLGSLVKGSRGRHASLLAQAKPLSKALTRLLGAPSLNAQVQAAAAMGALSAIGSFRHSFVCDCDAVSALVALVREHSKLDEVAPLALPNALAALHNCSLVPEATEQLATPEVAASLLPLVTKGPAGSRLLRRRAAAVLAKTVSRNAQVVAKLLDSASAVGAIATLFKEEVERRSEGAAAAAAPVVGGEEADELEDDEGGGLVGATLRILTCCAKDEAAAAAVCEAGALPKLVEIVHGSGGLAAGGNQGNAALCIAECAREARCLAVLAVLPIVSPLLDMAHNRDGQEGRNAAIALGRLAKNPHCLQAIRDNHGIEILARATAKLKA